MHAVSDDLLHWTKQPGEMFFSPGDNFESHDWRDPFVFWNPEAKEYWMLTAARLKTGPSRRRGCTALSTSRDLVHWTVRDPFWAPGLYFTHECPDLFKMGDWWYLVFSEFSERMHTRYRMARSLKGPWLTPANDTFDGRAYYAAKTASGQFKGCDAHSDFREVLARKDIDAVVVATPHPAHAAATLPALHQRQLTLHTLRCGSRKHGNAGAILSDQTSGAPAMG